MVKNYMFKMYLGDNVSEDSQSRENIYGEKFYTKLNTEKEAWDEISNEAVKFGFNYVLIEIADGIKYKSHPEIAIEGAWEADELKDELKKLRAKGLTPIPKLNFSTAHDAWLGLYSRMISTPEYYSIVKDIISEVIDIFDIPEMFHIGLEDEGHHSQIRYDYVCFRQHDLYWHDYKFLIDCVREKGVRPWVSVDPYIVNKERFLENTDKDVVISPLYENHFFTATGPVTVKDPASASGKRLTSFTELPALGYDIIPTFSTRNNMLRVDHIIRYVHKLVNTEKVKAILIAPDCPVKKSKIYQFVELFCKTKEARKNL